MDIEMQMEAQGYDWLASCAVWSRELTFSRLPTKFNSTQDQNEQSHMASNVAAAMENSDTPTAPATELKPNQAPVTTGSGNPKAETSQPAMSSSAPNGVLHDSEPLTQNGGYGDTITVNKEFVVPDSQTVVDMPAPSQLEPTLATSVASFGQSVISSSTPAEVQPSPATAETTEPVMESISEPAAPPQPPISDLRTSPHADALSSSEVATVEEQKHEEDNAAAAPVVASAFAAVESSIVPPAPVSSLVAETSKVGASGLATPPTQSPPPTPHPAPAELPENPPLVPAVEVPEPPIFPLEQPVEPVPTPAEPAPPAEDLIMTDVASPPVKVAREREEDEDEPEPAAKRMKTDDEQRTSETAEFKMPEAPATASSPRQASGTPPVGVAPPDGDDSVTQPRLAHMKKSHLQLEEEQRISGFSVTRRSCRTEHPKLP